MGWQTRRLAARAGALSIGQIADRLDERFDLATGATAGVPSRQRTLRAAMEWSYGLLEEPERALLGRLSVFAGAGHWSGGGGLHWGVVTRGAMPQLLGGLMAKSLV